MFIYLEPNLSVRKVFTMTLSKLLLWCLYFTLILLANIVFNETASSKMFSDIHVRRIIGGTVVNDKSAYPFIAHVKFEDHSLKHDERRSFCAGTIISSKHILFSARCTWIDEKNKFVGKHKIRVFTETLDWQTPGRTSKVKTLYIHPKYNIPLFQDTCFRKYDIALLELEKPLTFNQYCSAVRLPVPAPLGSDLSRTETTEFTERGVSCVVLGWGLTGLLEQNQSQWEHVDPILRMFNETLLRNEKCIEIENTPEVTNKFCNDSQICIGDDTGKSTVTDGDIGDPLICNGIQVGLATYIHRGDTAVQPSTAQVFTRLDVYMDFINNIVQDSNSVTLCVSQFIIFAFILYNSLLIFCNF